MTEGTPEIVASTTSKNAPILYVVIPCYNEAEVLPITHDLFRNEVEHLIAGGLISFQSKILFVDDGSKDSTWGVIEQLARTDSVFRGIKLTRNKGHQNALLAGLMEARNLCDISISIDCDGQDSIEAMEEMVKQYRNGCDIVYGVRDNRDSDSFAKRSSAQGFYKLMEHMGGLKRSTTMQITGFCRAGRSMASQSTTK